MYIQVYMNYITTTQLRTMSSKLINSLLRGEKVNLVHRSKLVGVIKPEIQKTKIFNAKRFLKNTRKIHLPILDDKKIEKRYREHLNEKYGKSIS